MWSGSKRSGGAILSSRASWTRRMRCERQTQVDSDNNDEYDHCCCYCCCYYYQYYSYQCYYQCYYQYYYYEYYKYYYYLPTYLPTNNAAAAAAAAAAHTNITQNRAGAVLVATAVVAVVSAPRTPSRYQPLGSSCEKLEKLSSRIYSH